MDSENNTVCLEKKPSLHLTEALNNHIHLPKSGKYTKCKLILRIKGPKFLGLQWTRLRWMIK